jgi:type VI protein secretion system component Hcp
MANDVYVKFGECPDKGGPLNTPLPDIEGDSSDALHYWWCELRECGFDMDTPQQTDDGDGQGGNGQGSTSGGNSNSQPTSGFKTVRLRKRVDWASTQLFLKCCQAAMATTTKSTDDQADGRIDKVTVEVCRPASGDQTYTLDDGTPVQLNKIPCATVEYRGVRVIRYELSISGPEPAESITFEFDSLRYKYLRTKPDTGEVVDRGGLKTPWMDNHHPDARATTGDSAAGGDGNSGASGSAGTAAPGAATPSPATAPAGAGGSPPAPGSAPDPTVNVNFPGLWQGTGFGLLPD